MLPVARPEKVLPGDRRCGTLGADTFAKGAGGMFLDGLDELDRKIVRLLIANARISYSELGEQVGISRVAPRCGCRRLKRKA